MLGHVQQHQRGSEGALGRTESHTASAGPISPSSSSQTRLACADFPVQASHLYSNASHDFGFSMQYPVTANSFVTSSPKLLLPGEQSHVTSCYISALGSCQKLLPHEPNLPILLAGRQRTAVLPGETMKACKATSLACLI